MPLGELFDSTKNYLDERLKNPYFVSVIAVWIITNKVLFFGLFNFSEDQSLSERIVWVHNRLIEFKRWGFTGPIGGVLFALTFGLVAMSLFNLLSGLGKSIYKLVNKVSNYMLRLVEPSKWVKTTELNLITSELDRTNSELFELRKKLGSESAEKEKLNGILKTKEESIESLREELNTTQNSNERNDSELDRLKYELSTEREKFDRFKATQNRINLLSLPALVPAEFFKGKWKRIVTTGPNQGKIELFTINKERQYTVDGKRLFNIYGLRVNNNHITFTKREPAAKIDPMYAELSIIDDGHLFGKEGGDNVQYLQIDLPDSM